MFGILQMGGTGTFSISLTFLNAGIFHHIVIPSIVEIKSRHLKAQTRQRIPVCSLAFADVVEKRKKESSARGESCLTVLQSCIAHVRVLIEMPFSR
jgi:hypothetical protein